MRTEKVYRTPDGEFCSKEDYDRIIKEQTGDPQQDTIHYLEEDEKKLLEFYANIKFQKKQAYNVDATHAARYELFRYVMAMTDDEIR